MLAYAAAAGLAWRLLQGRSTPRWGGLRSLAVVFALGLHGLLWHDAVFGSQGLRFGFAHALSLTLWLVALLTWLESLQNGTLVLEVVAYPMAAVALPLPLMFKGSLAHVDVDSPWFKVHLVTAIGAYSLMTVAAAHAVLMAVQEKSLHAPSRKPLLALDRLPPLMVMERLLFRIVWLGFGLLTLSLLTGVAFSEASSHEGLRFDHKTIFALVSWVLFGALLFGRHAYGWRGKMALRWTLSGFATLLLAYIGSRFVLEVILHRPVV
jgi:ABC-type uncharacterized transport system permease subunit